MSDTMHSEPGFVRKYVFSLDHKVIGILESIEFTDKKVEGALHFVIKADEFYVPTEAEIDVTKQVKELEDQLKYAKGFLKSVMGKLGNEKFVNNAPADVVENERKKQADAEAKIKTLEASLALLKK